MTILKLHEPSGEEIYINSARVAYFKVKRADGHLKNTLTEIHFSDACAPIEVTEGIVFVMKALPVK